MIPDGQPVLDLTATPAIESRSASMPALAASAGNIAEKPYDPSRDRETTRGQIAMTLVWTLVGLVFGTLLIAVSVTLACSWKDACSAETANLSALKIVVEILLTPLVGLVGAVAGFYFGEKSAKGQA